MGDEGPDFEIRGREFELHQSIEVDATPGQVWQAIATGPGIDSWFMGRNEIEPEPGGRTTMTFLGQTSHGTVDAYEPGRRFKQTSDTNPDGTFMAMEYLIEGREGGSTVVRMVHSGFLGDDWESEYDGLRIGDRKYLRKLAVYLKHFPGRTSTFDMFTVGPAVHDAARVWDAFKDVLGLKNGDARPGSPIRLAVDGLPSDDGVLEFADHGFMGARTDTGLYMLIHGLYHQVVVQYHDYAPHPDGERTEHAWQEWLTRTFPTPA
jgi:uncharacterized protein YndB with AHSA1/START domain